MDEQPKEMKAWLEWWAARMLATGREDAASAVNAVAYKLPDFEREVVARLAKAVGPLTMTAEREAEVRDVLSGDAQPAAVRVERAADDLLREVTALRASLAARDSEIGRLRHGGATTERQEADASHIHDLTAERDAALARAEAAEGDARAARAERKAAEREAGDARLDYESMMAERNAYYDDFTAATARAEAAERERDEARYALRAMTTDRDVAFRATSEATTLGIKNTQTALREADSARARVADLESALTRERAAHAALREAAERVIEDRDETRGDRRLCGWCAAVLPEQPCSPDCL